MKIRNDFVTNSSSSSFILAQKGDFTDAQKIAIFDAIKSEIVGQVLIKPDASQEDIKQYFDENYLDEESDYDREICKAIREALSAGKTVYGNTVNFECDYDIEGLLEKVWSAAEESGDGSFVGIDTDLSY